MTINLTKTSVEINNTELKVPFDINKVKALLGEARIEDDKHFFYDECGIMLTIRNDEVIEIAIKMKHIDEPGVVDPTKVFDGALTINGMDWFDFQLSGNDKTLMCEREFGDFVVLSFTDTDPETSNALQRENVISVILQLYPNSMLEEFFFDGINQNELESFLSALSQGGIEI